MIKDGKYYTKKVKIRPTSKQKKIIEGILDELTDYYNAYLRLCQHYKNEYEGYIIINDLDPDKYKFWDYCDTKTNHNLIDETNEFMLEVIDPKYILTKKGKISDDLTKRVIKNIKHGYMLYREKINTMPPCFKSKLKHEYVHSIWFSNSHNNIRIDSKKPNRIKMNYLGSLYIYNFNYIKDIESDEIKSAILKKEIDGSYSLNILINHPKIRDIGKLSDGIGIDLGVRKYITVEGKDSFSIPNPYDTNPNLRHMRRRVNLFQHIIDIKINKIKRIHPNLNKEQIYDLIHKSNKMQNLYDKKRKALYRVTCMMDDFMKKLAIYIIERTQPKFITIEDFRVREIAERHSSKRNRHKLINCRFAAFIKILKNVCNEAGIEVRIAPQKFKSSKTCSYCGHVREKFSNQRNYICTNENCDMYKIPIDRDVNAARNLYKLKRSECSTIRDL